MNNYNPNQYPNPNQFQNNNPYGYQPNPQQQYNAQMYYQAQQEALQLKHRRNSEMWSLIGTGVLLGGAIIAYLIIMTVIVLALNASKYYSVYETSSTFQNCFNVVAVHLTSMLIPYSLLALILKKNFNGRRLIPLEKVGFVKTAAWVGFGMGCALAANIVTNAVIKVVELLGYKLTQPEMLETDSVIACISVIISTAVVPAIFEEFAFRCCALGVLQRYGKTFAVIAVSIVFGLTHGNAIQFVFAFLLGLVLGYITLRTDSVVPAMIIHGLNNGLSVVQDVVKYGAGKSVSDTVTNAAVIFFIAAGIAGFVYLIINKEFKKLEEKRIKQPYELSAGVKALCLVPGLIIPFIILLFMTSQYITKI